MARKNVKKKTVSYNIAYLITTLIMISGKFFTYLLLNFETLLYSGTMLDGHSLL